MKLFFKKLYIVLVYISIFPDLVFFHSPKGIKTWWSMLKERIAKGELSK